MTPLRSTLLAAALNLSGLGVGYLFLGLPWLAVAHVAGLVIWWFVSDGGVGGIVFPVAWILVGVVAAAVLGGRRSPAAVPPGVVPPGAYFAGPVPVVAPGRGRWPVPVAATTAVVLVVASLTAVGVYNTAAASTLGAARDAHTQGDCEQAIEDLGNLSDGFLRHNLTAPADEVGQETGACWILQDARAQRSDPERAVSTYDDYLARDGVRFAGAADEQALARLDNADRLAGHGDREAAVAELTTVAGSGLAAAREVPGRVGAMYDDAVGGADGDCEMSETLEWFADRDEDVVADVSATARRELPGALLDCASDLFSRARESVRDDPRDYDAGLFDKARSRAGQLRADFPGTPAAGRAETLVSRIDEAAGRAADRRRELKIIDDIKATTGGKLEQPRSSGSSGSGSAQVVVENGSAETLEVLWTGPTTGKVRIDPGDYGDDCTDYRTRPTESITLPSGDYTVVVQAVTDSGVVPFKGNWSMGAGTRYGECYYIKSSYGGYDPFADIDPLDDFGIEPIEP
ncbi:hypothetical protein [Myceligenerans crystallogenes]|uniref:Uncharacterized protein n=1 Tax=Myceligenerans crystallogenes TaxID=316335 RepID=A0ABP4ZQ36_9MICO